MNSSRDDLLATAATFRRLPDRRQRVLIRKRAGVSQRSMATALGVSTMTLARWEKGLRPRSGNAAAYLELLDELEQLTG